MKKHEEAVAIYEKAKQEGRTAGLLELNLSTAFSIHCFCCCQR
ncbi:hypothetical protein [uncultured Nostoc sp.]